MLVLAYLLLGERLSAHSFGEYLLYLLVGVGFVVEFLNAVIAQAAALLVEEVVAASIMSAKVVMLTPATSPSWLT